MKKFKEFVNEAYMSPEHAKQIRDELKKTFPEFKFSVRNDNYSSINIAILSGPIKLTDKEDGYEQVNHYYIKDHYKHNPEAADFLEKVNKIANKGNYDNSDIMTDYFDVGWYVHMSIGQWDRPYVVTSAKPTKSVKQPIKTPYVRQTLEEDIKIYPYKNNSYVLVGLGTKNLINEIRNILGGWFNKFFTNPNTGERFSGWGIRADKLEAAKELTGVSEISEW